MIPLKTYVIFNACFELSVLVLHAVLFGLSYPHVLLLPATKLQREGTHILHLNLVVIIERPHYISYNKR